MSDMEIVVHGDCLDVMKDIPDDSIDFVLTDPPYGTTSCKWDKMPDLDKLWEVLKPIGKDNCAYVFTASQPFTSKLVVSNLKWFKYEWIWDKVTARGHLVAKKRPMAQHENIICFYKSPPNYTPQMVDRPKDKIEYRKTTEYGRTDIMGGSKSNAPSNKVYDKWYPNTQDR
jgi:site-specific DNA-methyltransferase (adenine-specific)